MNARELIEFTSILDVWLALGGGPLRHGRGRAWWRNGDGFNVSLSEEKACWHDFAGGEGGGVLDLIATARRCDRREALEWLAAYRGVSLDGLTQRTAAEKRIWARQRRAGERDLEAALHFARTITVLTEEVLAQLEPCDPEREGLTRLLRAVRLVVEAHQDPTHVEPTWYALRPSSEAALLAEYRAWGRRRKVTRALVAAGRAADEAGQLRFAHVLMEAVSAKAA